MLKYRRKHVWFQIKETGCFSLWLVQCDDSDYQFNDDEYYDVNDGDEDK